MARHDARTAARRRPTIVVVLVVLALVAGLAWIVVAGIVQPGLRTAAPAPSGRTPTPAPIPAALSPTPTVTPTTTAPTPAPTPSTTEDPASIAAADRLLSESEQHVGSQWFEISVLAGQSCTLSSGGHGLQSARTDNGATSTTPSADAARIRAYWDSLGLTTTTRPTSDPTGPGIEVEGRGGAAESIVYTTAGVMTVTTRCTRAIAVR